MRHANFQILYWCEDTARVGFETGVQRVTRRLADAMVAAGACVAPIGWDERAKEIVELQTVSRRATRRLDAFVTDRAILFVPEIPLSLAGAGLDPVQLGRAYGLRTAALVHDLIPIKLAADYDPAVVAIYRRYYRQFASADLILATTDYVASDLQSHLAGEGLAVPRPAVVPLPAEFPSSPRLRAAPPARAPQDALRLLTVTTLEPRKNLLRLLRAIRQASSACGCEISLDIIGRSGAFPDYDRQVLAVVEDMPKVKMRGPLTDAALVSLYRDCHASIYPSIEEGFGMPIGESLWLGRPCVCHNGSSMAEVAPGGGTLLVDMMAEGEIAEALVRLATDPDLSTRLAAEAAMRPLRDWAAFADDVVGRLAAIASGS